MSAERIVKLWLFDFDNTLAALEPVVDWAASRRELESMLRETGLVDDLLAEFPRGNLLLYDAVRARLLGGAGTHRIDAAAARAIVVEASAIIERHELAGVDRAAPAPGAVELLRALDARGTPAAIVTSNSARTIARWLARHRLTDAIRVTVGRDSLLALKPAPGMLLRALELCAVEPDATALAGDSEADFLAARAAHVRFYGVSLKPQSRNALAAAGATEVFGSPAALAIHLNLTGPDSAPTHPKSDPCHNRGD